MLAISVKQRYVVVVMMFFVMAMVFALRMSFPIVLTQMVYVPNIHSNSEKNHSTSAEIICLVKSHMIENVTNFVSDSSQSVQMMVILPFKKIINSSIFSVDKISLLDSRQRTLSLVTKTARNYSIVVLLGEYFFRNSWSHHGSTNWTKTNAFNFNCIIGIGDRCNTFGCSIWCKLIFIIE